MSVPRWLVVALAVVLLASGCRSDDDAPPPGAEGPPPSATLGLTQLIPLEGTEHALLRVTNTSTEPFTVLSVRIDWPGYPDGTAAPESATLAADQTLLLRFDLPAPACEPADLGDGPVTGVVETDRGLISQRLEHTGTVYVRRLWHTQCDEVLLGRSVRLSYSREWSVAGSGTGARALGALLLERREGRPPIAVTSVDGSVLHGLRLPGPTTLAPLQPAARIPLEITPGDRCEEHARGQATAPFDFLVRLEIDGQRLAVPLDVPLAAMNAATAALDIACEARAAR